MSTKHTSGLALARKFHEAYERLAPQFGYETRQETRAFDPKSANGRLMVAVCAELLEKDEAITALMQLRSYLASPKFDAGMRNGYVAIADAAIFNATGSAQ